jgi:hypothetical protein
MSFCRWGTERYCKMLIFVDATFAAVIHGCKSDRNRVMLLIICGTGIII